MEETQLETIKNDYEPKIEAIGVGIDKVENEEDANKVSEALAITKRITKELDDMRKDMTRPLDDSKKKIMGFFKTFSGGLEEKKVKLSGMLIEYQEKIEKEEEEERKRIIAEQKEKEDKIKADGRMSFDAKDEKLQDIEKQASEQHSSVVSAEKRRSGITIKTIEKVEIDNVPLLMQGLINLMEIGKIGQKDIEEAVTFNKTALKKILVIDSENVVRGARIVKEKNTSL